VLGGREPLASMRDSAARLGALVGAWSPQQFERPYAPGKWTARQVMVHLAQTELALGVRARMALSTVGYAAQKFDQDAWVAREARVSGADAAAAFAAISHLNVMFFEGLSDAERQTPMAHPEYGSITVDWIIHTLAGHQLHHLAQLEALRSA
jgi:hypothetical protein